MRRYAEFTPYLDLSPMPAKPRNPLYVCFWRVAERLAEEKQKKEEKNTK